LTHYSRCRTLLATSKCRTYAWAALLTHSEGELKRSDYPGRIWQRDTVDLGRMAPSLAL